MASKPTVFFNQSTYTVDEHTGLVQPVLILSEPQSTEFTVLVIDHNHTATGKLY